MDVLEESKKEAAKIKTFPKTIDQHILWSKGIFSRALEDNKIEGCYCGKMEFGFSERMVNYLMQMAYDKAIKDNQEQYRRGYNDALENVRESIQELGEGNR
jgi:hypothetical protein